MTRDVYKYFIRLDILFGVASIFNLAAISLERMYAVKFPTRHFNLSTFPVILVVIGTWSIGIILTGLHGAINDNREYTAIVFVVGYCLPLALIVTCYSAIFYAAIHMMKALNQVGRIHNEIKIAKTICIIICLFIFCWTPFFIVNMVYVYCTKDCLGKPLWPAYLTKMIHYSNSMMNFFVYAAKNPDFRAAFKAIFSKCNIFDFHGAKHSLSLEGDPTNELACHHQDNLKKKGNKVLEKLSLHHKPSRTPSLNLCTDTSSLCEESKM